ncbi:hypothetical protein [Allomesorhizobium camelthorni]|uniref:Uncharacterized protein n=1 Tax=Allomesorhizobium camelthorni TaxID=475069 RepID=A0A6G4WLT0_9HYPH|nr:hypothetical protein [Mesorhizobium camelthorni]NGO55559.1 hypothetical protein [Mesorhizobium camelthorni]
MTYVSQELAAIQADALELQKYASADKSALQERINDIPRRAVEVRDVLSTNPHVQVTGLSVTNPWGVTFEFAFPTPAR